MNSLNNAKPTVAHMLGEVIWVLAQSPTHKHFAFSDLEWLIIPPISSEQYFVFRDDTGAPFAFALWAFLTDESADKLDQPVGRLRPDEWSAGEELWLVDLVTIQSASTQEIRDRCLRLLMAEKFKGKIVNMHVFDKEASKKKRVQMHKVLDAVLE